MKRVLYLLILLVSVILSVTGCSSTSVTAENTAEGPKDLFDDRCVHRIDVRIADADWEDLLANPLEKTKYKVDIEIDGVLVEDVSFATKGNSSLAFVVADGNSSRYSFKVNFGKFVDGQTFNGLDKLNLNNNFADATNMRDYFSYEVFRQAGAI